MPVILGLLQAPVDAEVNVTAAWVTTIVFALGVIFTVLVMVHESRKELALWPLALLIGSTIAFSVEPIADLLGAIWYPNANVSWTVELMGRDFPAYIPMSYPTFFLYFYYPYLVFRTRKAV